MIANIWQFLIIYILPPPKNTITVNTSVQCWIRKHFVKNTTDHYINPSNQWRGMTSPIKLC